MSDNFQVPSHAAAVTPSDTGEIFASALYIGGAGAVSVVTEAGETVTLASAQAGSTIVLRVKRVNATGTTATNIIRLW